MWICNFGFCRGGGVEGGGGGGSPWQRCFAGQWVEACYTAESPVLAHSHFSFNPFFFSFETVSILTQTSVKAIT